MYFCIVDLQFIIKIYKLCLLARIRVALRLKYEKDWHANQKKKIRDELDLAMQVQRSLLSEPVHGKNVLPLGLFRSLYHAPHEFFK